MQRLMRPVILVALVAVPSVATAQTEAAKAFADGKAAYEKGDFDKARDLFAKASQTDVRNPEVFLWLGKAHYQSGQVDEAMAAWTRTLRLAPDEPYAKKMLRALRGQLVEADAKIRLVEALLNARLYSAADSQARVLLADKTLTDAQRAKAMTLRAGALLEMRRYTEVVATVQEVLLRFAGRADAAQTTLLLGQARLRLGRENVPKGLTLLKKVLAEHAGKPAAASAEYELLGFRLGQKPDLTAAGALEKWIKANAAHAKADEARRRLVDAYLALTRLGPRPGEDTALSGTDTAALAVAAERYKQIVQAKEALDLTRRFVRHFDEHYARHGAHLAAVAGAEGLLKAQLPSASRSAALRALAAYRRDLAVKVLTDQAKAGTLPAKMPEVLVSALAVHGVINKEFPGQPAWVDQAALAERVRVIGTRVPWPKRGVVPKAPYAWAVQIALEVVKGSRDRAAVSRAATTIGAVVKDCRQFTYPPGRRGMALGINTRLLAAMPVDAAAWPQAMLRQIDLLDAHAAAVFSDNVKAGKAEVNAALGAHQGRLLAAMARLVGRDAAHASAMVARLRTHLQRWIDHGHYAAAEAAYGQFVEALPEAQANAVRLEVARLWVRQAVSKHNRLLTAGLKVPRKIDPMFAKALERCYGLQAGLDEADAFLKHVRGVWEGVVEHYKRLEYFDTAEEAIKTKPAAAVAVADAYAQFALARLRDHQARRELAAFLKRYKAAEKITLTAAFKTAIAEYTRVISTYPSSPLAGRAVGAVFDIAGLFSAQKAYDVSVGVYRDFAAFAAKVKVLAQAPPGQASALVRARFAAAGDLHAKAAEALAKATAEKKPGAPPPANLSVEFAAAVGAYKDFIKANPDSALLRPAIGQILSVAAEYAKADAWDVAGGVCDDLLKSGLALRRPERIEFCRGLCELGKVMPGHAREVLEALVRARPDLPTSGVTRDWQRSMEDIARRRAPATSPAKPGRRGRLGNDIMARKIKAPEPERTGMDDEIAKADVVAMVAIRRQQQRRAGQVAQLRETRLQYGAKAQGGGGKRVAVAPPVLSEAEIARRQVAFDAAYKIFQAIRKNYTATPTADHARGEIRIMVQHWRTVGQWQRAAALGEGYLTDNPADAEVPSLRLAVARDYLAWAVRPVEKRPSKQVMLAEVAGRFDKARQRLAAIVQDLPDEKSIVHQAQWDTANSFLTQARVVDAFSPTLARGQYVRAARELQQVAETYHDHPNISAVPKMVWDISNELSGRGYHEEAVAVWNALMIHYPTHSLAQQAAERIARTYRDQIKRPLLAAEAYLELNFARGGDRTVQNRIYQIGVALKNEKRWVEALHVLEVFVDSFPRHPSAGSALTMVGQIHQANEVWADAIAAYRRVISEFPQGTWVRDAKWSIAECTINLSRWREAMSAYRSYLRDYPKDANAAKATRRIATVKDLARYQALVDEQGQRKAFYAQYQIAEIVRTHLSNPAKAIIEYRKVADKWPKSHLADDALFKVGTTYLLMGATAKAREALLAVNARYPTSPLADDALYMVGRSHEAEAVALAAVTRERTVAKAKEKAQKKAYREAQSARYKQRALNIDRIEKLRKGGKKEQAELEVARGAAQAGQYDAANVLLAAQRASQETEALTAAQLADRQDKINAALRKAVGAYTKAAKVPLADKAAEALLKMAVIYAEKLKDPDAAMATYREIVRQFSGTAVAEDASWRIAQYYEREGKHAEAIKAYEAFLRNYRGSGRAPAAQFAIAENREQLGEWVKAMEAYTNYIDNYPKGPLAEKAKQQITWIKTYRL